MIICFFVHVQIDYGRSLGDIVEQSESAVSAAVRQLVLAKSSPQAKKILHSWELFISVHNDSKLYYKYCIQMKRIGML